MKKVYACLAGKWVCLNDDPDCVMGSDHLSPTDWYKLTHDVYAPVNLVRKMITTIWTTSTSITWTKTIGLIQSSFK